jgi:hypothetical protein
MTMTITTSSSAAGRLKPAAAGGWFAAGAAFDQAMTVLSDGAFKLFVYLCLRADRRTGQTVATQRELARALGKSQRVIGRYVKELASHQVCHIQEGTNQHARTGFRIAEPYWPYHRLAKATWSVAASDYVAAVRESFLALGCTRGRFAAAEEKRAQQLEAQGIPLAVVQDALVLGACRKYTAWINGQAHGPIGSLRYFDSIIAEIQAGPWPDGYGQYLRTRLPQMRRQWEESAKADPRTQIGLPSPASEPVGDALRSAEEKR